MVTRRLLFSGALLTIQCPSHLVSVPIPSRRPPEIDILIAARRLPQQSASSAIRLPPK